MSMTLVHTNGHGNGSIAHPTNESWLKLTVKEFFSGINWDNNPSEVQELKVAAFQGDVAPLSLMLSVNQFFAAVNWDGMVIAPSPVSTSLETNSGKEAKDFTLEEFSGLF
jgi:hypothetical protein